MKALSIRQPWAWLVLKGYKTIECRNWAAPKHMAGQEFLVHAGGKLDRQALGILTTLGIADDVGDMKPGQKKPSQCHRRVEELRSASSLESWELHLSAVRRHEMLVNALVLSGVRIELGGVLVLLAPHQPHPSEQYGFIVEVVEVFSKPVPCPGRLGFFDVPEEALRRCRVCGCSEFNACTPPCHWVGPDLCSACEEVTI